MGFQTKIQLINRKQSRQWYVNFPSACAQMMNFRKGEVVEWVITPGGDLVLKRPNRTGENDEKRDI
jgi:hypothetical protein